MLKKNEWFRPVGGSLHEFCFGHAELVLEGQQCSETVDHATGHRGFMLRADTSLEMADEVGPYDFQI